jgi:acyl-CoA thioester hydrolase
MSDTAPAFTHRLVVRFRDCDMLGHVNNAVYFTYLEQARLAWWRHLGGGSGFPGANTVIVHASCDYRAPAFLNDELDVRVALAAVGRSSVTLTYAIVNSVTGQLIAEGKSVNVTVDETATKPIAVPEATRALLTGTNLPG